MESNYMTAKQTAKLNAWKAWGNKMAFLRNIHLVIAPKLKQARKAIEL
jgi:hypothetical protein|tara:strand:+ start:76 stop:219 length:144 start_codon:yes stop_codon:yes gene_type:complete